MRKKYKKNKNFELLLLHMHEKNLSQSTRRKIFLSIINSEEQINDLIKLVQSSTTEEIEKIY